MLGAGQGGGISNNNTIRIITSNGIRYEGKMYEINLKEKTIALQNVISHGSEDRRTDKFIPPTLKPIECVVFSAKDIKDLSVLTEEETSKLNPVQERQPQEALPPPPSSLVLPSPPPPVLPSPPPPPLAEPEKGLGDGLSGLNSDKFSFEQMELFSRDFEAQKMQKGGSLKQSTPFADDNFFDSLQHEKEARPTRKEEIELNEDTFGQNATKAGPYRARGRGRGFRGRGRGASEYEGYRRQRGNREEPGRRREYGGYRRDAAKGGRGRYQRQEEEVEYYKKKE